MKSPMVFIVAFGHLWLFSPSSLAQAKAPATPTMVITITTCRYVITTPGTYTESVGPCESPGLVINSSNVTLENFFLDGPVTSSLPVSLEQLFSSEPLSWAWPWPLVSQPSFSSRAWPRLSRVSGLLWREPGQGQVLLPRPEEWQEQAWAQREAELDPSHRAACELL